MEQVLLVIIIAIALTLCDVVVCRLILGKKAISLNGIKFGVFACEPNGTYSPLEAEIQRELLCRNADILPLIKKNVTELARNGNTSERYSDCRGLEYIMTCVVHKRSDTRLRKLSVPRMPTLGEMSRWNEHDCTVFCVTVHVYRVKDNAIVVANQLVGIRWDAKSELPVLKILAKQAVDKFRVPPEKKVTEI